MLAKNVTLSNKQEGKTQIWNKILILISANRRFWNRSSISINPICNLYLPFYALLRVTFCVIITEFRIKDTTVSDSIL